MSFITEADLLNGAFYPEQLEAITRSDDSLLPLALGTAEEECKSYLRPNYNITAIFAATGDARNKLLVTYCRDMAAYHLACMANPGIDFETKKDRYERAIRFLEHVQAGKVNPGLPKDETADTAPISYGSNEKRNNHF